MKTKTIFLKSFLTVLLIVSVFSCKKGSDAKPQSTDTFKLLAVTWTTPQWGGVNNNPLTFVIDESSATGVITTVGSQPYGFAVGDKLLTNITANSDGTYNCMGKYTYGTQSQNSGMRSAVLSLQNNNTQLTIDYAAINSSFPEIIYVYQK